MNKKQFIEEVEKLHITKKIDYIDAIVSVCQKYDLDIELIAGVVSSNQVLKFKVQEEAEKLRYIKKETRLPI